MKQEVAKGWWDAHVFGEVRAACQEHRRFPFS